MALKNYTSTQSVFKSAMELERILVDHGAMQIQKDTADGKITALRFIVNTAVGIVPFELPVNVEAVYKKLEQDKKSNARVKLSFEQAERTAWKCLLDWTAAQMALIEIGMVKMKQVFLPYAVNKDGRTFFEMIAAKGFYLMGGDDDD